MNDGYLRNGKLVKKYLHHMCLQGQESCQEMRMHKI